LVRGGRFGLSFDGSAAWGNQNFGVQVTGTGSRVVGALVSGNNGPGIIVDGGTGVAISDCVVGLSAGQTGALPNTRSGISVTSSAKHTIVHNNTIGGNRDFGLQIWGNMAWVEGNRVGVDETTQVALGNLLGGVYVVSNNVTIISNVVSGNLGSGVVMLGSFGLARGNVIGMDASRTLALPNRNKACFISGSFCTLDANYFPSTTSNPIGIESIRCLQFINSFKIKLVDACLFLPRWCSILVSGWNATITGNQIGVQASTAQLQFARKHATAVYCYVAHGAVLLFVFFFSFSIFFSSFFFLSFIFFNFFFPFFYFL
jgi:hypothetical protein